MVKQWYAVWVLTGSEAAAEESLDKTPGVEALLPRADLWERSGGEWRQISRVVYPGYVFIRCRMDSRIYYAIKELPQVIGWLGKDTLWPGSIPDEQMARVQALMAGEPPESILREVIVHKRRRRGYGLLRVGGRDHRIPFNVYKQAGEPGG